MPGFFFCGDGGFYLNIIKPEVNISLKELLNSFKGGVSLVVGML